MKTKKKYIMMLVIGLILISATPVIGTNIELINLHYKDKDLVFVPGNVSLVFNNSTTGDEDTSIIWRIYSSENNLTIFYVSSNEIDITGGFVNDTKSYYYNDTNSNNTYIIKVNYTDLIVPVSIEEILNETIDAKNAKIQNLTMTITNLSADLNQSKSNTTQWFEQSNVYKIERDQAVDENLPLKNQIKNLQDDVNHQQNLTNDKVDELRMKKNEINSLNGTIQELANPWSMGYTLRGVSNGPYINFASLIFGIIIALGIVFAVQSVLDKKGITLKFRRRKTIGGFQPIKSSEYVDDLAVSDPPKLQQLRQAEKNIAEGETKPTQPDKEKKTDEKPSEEKPKPDNEKIEDIESKVDQMITNKNEYIR